MNCTPKVGHIIQFYEVQFFMAKYSNEFKLKVVQYHLQGYGKKHTAKVFPIHHSIVSTWVSRYILHGKYGINRRPNTTVYPLDFKLDAIGLVPNGRRSRKETCVQLNLPANFMLLQWLKQYRQYGIDGLKPKGRKS